MKYRQLLDNSAILRQRNIDIYWYKKKKKGKERGRGFWRTGRKHDKADSPGFKTRKLQLYYDFISHLGNKVYKIDNFYHRSFPPSRELNINRYFLTSRRYFYSRGEALYSSPASRGERNKKKRRKIAEERFRGSEKEREKKIANAAWVDRSRPEKWRDENVIDAVLSTFVSNETPCA